MRREAHHRARVDELFRDAPSGQLAGLSAGTNGALDALSAWLHERLNFELPAPEIARDASGNKIKGPSPLREWRFWQIIPLTMALPVTLTGIFIYQAQMTTDLQATTTVYALGLTAMGIARFPGALMGGRWVDEWGVALLARLYLVPFAIAIIAAVLIGGNAGVLILMIGAGISLGMSSPVVDSLLVILWGREHLGRVRSVKSALMVFSTGLAPAVLGFLIDDGVSFAAILMGMLIFMLLGWLLAQGQIKLAGDHHQQKA